MKNFTFLIVFVIIPLSFAQQADDLTKIRYQGNYVIIPENKMGEFMKNYDKYVPKKQEQFAKTNGEITLDGYVTDAFTTEPIQNVGTILYLYDEATLLDTLGPIYTNSIGYYSFTVVIVEETNELTNIGFIEYYGGKARITTNTNKKIKITAYDILGQKINTILTDEIIGTKDFDLGLKDNQPMITQIEIDGKSYSQIHIKQGSIYSVREGKNIESITEGYRKELRKIQTLGGVMDFIPPNNDHHRYFSGVGYFDSDGNTRIDFALLPRMFLDSIIVDPNYTVIDTIKTFRDFYWYLMDIRGEWDNRIRSSPLYNWQLFIDTVNCPVEWKEPIRNSIKYYRDSIATLLGLEPDSLITESDQYNDSTAGLDFSPINVYYVSSLPNNMDSRRIIYFDATNEVFVGADIELNLSTGMSPIDVFKEVNRQLEEYLVGGEGLNRGPSWMLMDRWSRGAPYTMGEDDKKLTKQSYNIQKTNKRTYYNNIYP